MNEQKEVKSAVRAETKNQESLTNVPSMRTYMRALLIGYLVMLPSCAPGPGHGDILLAIAAFILVPTLGGIAFVDMMLLWQEYLDKNADRPSRALPLLMSLTVCGYAGAILYAFVS